VWFLVKIHKQNIPYNTCPATSFQDICHCQMAQAIIRSNHGHLIVTIGVQRGILAFPRTLLDGDCCHSHLKSCHIFESLIWTAWPCSFRCPHSKTLTPNPLSWVCWSCSATGGHLPHIVLQFCHAKTTGWLLSKYHGKWPLEYCLQLWGRRIC
jgi:hypothetical protein